jgi:hypothetical protein
MNMNGELWVLRNGTESAEAKNKDAQREAGKMGRKGQV